MRRSRGGGGGGRPGAGSGGGWRSIARRSRGGRRRRGGPSRRGRRVPTPSGRADVGRQSRSSDAARRSVVDVCATSKSDARGTRLRRWTSCSCGRFSIAKSDAPRAARPGGVSACAGADENTTLTTTTDSAKIKRVRVRAPRAIPLVVRRGGWRTPRRRSPRGRRRPVITSTLLFRMMNPELYVGTTGG